MSNEREAVRLTAADVGVLKVGEPADKELKMQRKVGDSIETHGVYESEWKTNGPALQQDGWSLVK